MSLTISTSTLQEYPARYLAAWNQRDIATALRVVHPQARRADGRATSVRTYYDSLTPLRAIGPAANSAGGQR